MREHVVQRAGLAYCAELILRASFRSGLRRRLRRRSLLRCCRRGIGCRRCRVVGRGRLRGNCADRRPARRRQLRLVADQAHQGRFGAGLHAGAVRGEVGAAGRADGGALFLGWLLCRERSGNADEKQTSEQRRSKHGKILTTLATVAVPPKQCTQGPLASRAVLPFHGELLTARDLLTRFGKDALAAW